MDKQALFSQVESMEERIGELYGELGSLKRKIIELLEVNQKLEIENEHLRQRLESSATEDPVAETEYGEGYDNLARLYHEGFHICHTKYGSLRTDGDCLFCVSFLHR